MESFAALFEESLSRQDMRSGEVISAEVVRLDHNFVIVNAGLKSEAFIPIEEFKNDQGELEVKVGDFVSVAIESLENGFGDTILSRDKAKRLASPKPFSSDSMATETKSPTWTSSSPWSFLNSSMGMNASDFRPALTITKL